MTLTRVASGMASSIETGTINTEYVSTSTGGDRLLNIKEACKQWLASLFTVKFLRVFAGGQILSLLICGTAVTSQLLNEDHSINAPTTQSFLNYLLLGLVYGITLAVRKSDENLYHVFRKRWWKYLIVALIDVEANYMVVKAYQFTTLVSVQLLDCITIPVVLLLSFLLLRVRYRINHLVGVAVCMIGVPLMIWADFNAGRSHSSDAPNKPLGDILCLVGASFYGVTNVAEEFAVRHFSRVEFLGMVGIFGTFISGIQLVILERDELATFSWNYESILLLLAFAICLFLLYSLFPLVIKWSSAAVVNISILTADFYTLLFGLFLFKYAFSGIYILSFVVIIVGVLLYSIHGTKEAAPDSRYNLFRDEHETVPNVESDANTLNGEGELTEEERDQMHKEFNRHLNGTN